MEKRMLSMGESKITSGYFSNGLPYNQFGHGSQNLIIFQGLMFENKPLTRKQARFFIKSYMFLVEDYTIYIVTRKQGLPKGYSMQNMADDYAVMIKKEFHKPVDILGISTGGSIAMYFAAAYPELVKKLVIHSSAYTLRATAKKAQMRVGKLANQKKWRAAYTTLMEISLPAHGFKRYLFKPFILIISLFGGMFFGKPENPSDLIVTIEAEDKHNFKNRLSEITVPTLIIAGDKDQFYSKKIFHETAKGIPNSHLILYTGMGHPASGKQFRKDLCAFLNFV